MPYSRDQYAMSEEPEDVNAAYYLIVYAALGILFMAVTLGREGVLFGGSLAASQRIHYNLIDKVTHAKFRFFDQTPLGQIMNRFSQDVRSIDQNVSEATNDVARCAFSILIIVATITYVTS